MQRLLEIVRSDAERSVRGVICGEQRGAPQELADERRTDAFKRVDEHLVFGSGNSSPSP